MNPFTTGGMQQQLQHLQPASFDDADSDSDTDSSSVDSDELEDLVQLANTVGFRGVAGGAGELSCPQTLFRCGVVTNWCTCRVGAVGSGQWAVGSGQWAVVGLL